MKKHLLLAGFVFLACVSTAQKKHIPYVILISFDGFRYDYVSKFNPPHFIEFIKDGSQAEAMVPSFPSKTFPNHYTIVTGLTPGHHGLVDNLFYDRKRHESYGMRDKNKVSDPYYYGGIPLWQLARQNNIKSASFFWVGSEMSNESRRPDYYYPYNDTISGKFRINQVLRWLALPEDQRPHLITLYFSSPDHEGHLYGPNSEETKNAVLRADSLLNDLMKGVRATKLPVNVVVVSDHGMSELTVEEESFVFIDELVDKLDTSVIVANGGTQAHLYINNVEKRETLYKELKTREGNKFKVLRKFDFPDTWQYRVERVGDLLMIAEPRHYIRGTNWATFLQTAKVGSKFGVHGFDPAIVSDMRGIFYAHGPNIRKGMNIKQFQNIHVYPFIARILQMRVPPIDGNLQVLKPLLKE